MAKGFSQEIQVDLGRNETDRSRGAESPLKAVGALFEGLGSTLGNYVKAKDELIRQDIQRTADAGVEGELGSILGSGTSQPAPGNNVPSEITEAGAKMSRYKSAYDQGKLSDLYFYGQVSNISKSLRSKYPGYSDLVDDALSNAIGTNPANRIRSELLAEFNAGSEKMGQTEKWRRDFVKQNDEVLGALGILPSTVDYGDDKSFATLQNAVSVYKGQREVINAKKSQLELGNAQDATTKRQAEQLATNDLTQRMRTWFNKDMNPAWKAYQDAYGEALKDKKLSPEERSQLATLFGQFKANVSLQVKGMLTGSDQSGFSYSSYMDKSARQNVEDIALSQIDIYEKLLTDQNFGLFNLTALENKAIQEGRENAAMSSEYGDILGNIKLLMSSGIDINNINEVMSQTYGKGWDDVKGKLIAGTVGLSTMSGKNTDFGKMIQDLQTKDGTLNPKDYQKIILQSSDLLSLPNQDPQIIANAAKAIYKPGDDALLMKQFKGQSRNQVFLSLTRPEITANLKGTEQFDAYANWSFNQFGTIGKTAVNDMLANNQVGKWIDVQFDTSKNQFVYRITPSVILQGIGRGGNIPAMIRRNNPQDRPIAFSADASSLKTVQQSLDFLNLYGARVKEIAEAGNMDSVEQLKTLYAGLGVGPDQAGPETVVGKVFQALQAANSEEQKTGKEKSNSTSKEQPNQIQGQSEVKTPTQLATFINSAEGADSNTMFGGERFPLTNMTVGEVQKLQKTWARAYGSSAAGKNQVMQGTLRELVQQGVVSLEDRFDDATQDKIFEALLKKRGVEDFRAGNISEEEFAENLSMEWASLPKDAGGRSYYEDDKMGNKARVSYDKLLEAIRTLN